MRSPNEDGSNVDIYGRFIPLQDHRTCGSPFPSAMVIADGTIGLYRLLMRPAEGPLNRNCPAIASDFTLFTSGRYGFLVAAEAQRAAGMVGIYGTTVLTYST